MKRGSMLETIVTLSFCLLVGLISLAVVVWEAVTRALFSLDGMAFALISLTLGGFMMFNIAWSFYKGEMRALLARPAQAKGEEKPASEPAATTQTQA